MSQGLDLAVPGPNQQPVSHKFSFDRVFGPTAQQARLFCRPSSPPTDQAKPAPAAGEPKAWSYAALEQEAAPGRKC